MKITHKLLRVLIKWDKVEVGTVFQDETGNDCLKLPEAEDKHGIFNCFCFDDGKYYTYKDHQTVRCYDRMELI